MSADVSSSQRLNSMGSSNAKMNGNTNSSSKNKKNGTKQSTVNGSINKTNKINNENHENRENSSNKKNMSALEYSIDRINELNKQNSNIMKQINSYTFDIFECVKYDCVKERPLLTLGMYIIINAKYVQPIINSNEYNTNSNNSSNNTNNSTNNTNNNNNKSTHDTSIYIFPKNHKFPNGSSKKNNNYEKNTNSDSNTPNTNKTNTNTNTNKNTNTNNANINANTNTNNTDEKTESYLSLDYCANFLQEIENTYQANPYHNRIHAADVVQFAHLLLCNLWDQKRFNSIECISILLAAAAHDGGHPGKNNDFLVKSKSKLLDMHDPPSVLENFHLHTAFKLINNNKNYNKYYQSKNSNSNSNQNEEKTNNKNNINNIDCNFFQTFSESDQIKMEDMMRFAVLGTDMNTYHKSIRERLSENKNTYNYSENQQAWTYDEKLFVGRVVLHMADISNPLRPFSIAKQWGYRVLTEFFQQGDVMKEMNLEVSFGCDREKHTSDAQNQIGFLNLFVLPLANLVLPLFPMIKETLENDNRQHWTEFEKENKSAIKPYSIIKSNENAVYNGYNVIPANDSIKSQ